MDVSLIPFVQCATRTLEENERLVLSRGGGGADRLSIMTRLQVDLESRSVLPCFRIDLDKIPHYPILTSDIVYELAPIETIKRILWVCKDHGDPRAKPASIIKFKQCKKQCKSTLLCKYD